jgi:uncharacterized protein (DUF736 family)
VPFPNTEASRRGVVRALVLNTEVVVVEDDDPKNQNPNADQFRIVKPTAIAKRTLIQVGLTNQQAVEVFRADLKIQLPLIDFEIASVQLSPATKIGLLRDFCTAALDMKG